MNWHEFGKYLFYAVCTHVTLCGYIGIRITHKTIDSDYDLSKMWQWTIAVDEETVRQSQENIDAFRRIGDKYCNVMLFIAMFFGSLFRFTYITLLIMSVKKYFLKPAENSEKQS